MMDEHAENGVCVGAIYSKDEAPGSAKGADIAGVVFSDGTVVKYDRRGHKMTIEISSGNVEITATKMKLTGDLEVTGKIKSSGDIETTTGNVNAPLGNVIAGPLSIGLTTHKHTGVTSGPSTTATPIQ
jgi:phage baseplate assembly protein gpV